MYVQLVYVSSQVKTICFIVDGKATVTPEGGAAIFIEPGDLCKFRKGLRCTWQVQSPVIKHYKTEEE